MERILEKLQEKGEYDMYSFNPAPWIDGGAHVRISCLPGGKYQALFWLTGDKYSGKPSKDILSSISELEGYLRKYSFI
jgi:hypothetical protein